MSATTLTGIFAPGSPALLESLRTLTITPTRQIEPGGTIRAEFVFSNIGGSVAGGVRARFALPAGVTHVEGSDRIDDTPLEPGQSFIAGEGAPVGDLATGAQHKISVAYRVNDFIEDGTTLAFQAAVMTDELPVTGSNIAQLTVRSNPNLNNPRTLVNIVAAERPKPGERITIRAVLFNSGQSSAHDVIAALPVPEHATYVPRSARVNGRPVSDEDGVPFDFSNASVVAPRLAPAQSITVEYQAEIDAPLADGTRMKVIGAVSSRETAEVPLVSSDIVIFSPVDFSSEETGMTIFADDAVTPGTRIAIAVRAMNTGSGPAQQVGVAFEFPAGFIFTPGSAMIDGQPVADDAFVDNAFVLGTLPAGRAIDVSVSGIVGVPSAKDHTLPIASVLRWRAVGGPGLAERRFTRTLTVRATPRFARARNYIDVDRRIAQAEEHVDFVVHLLNDGTAPDEGTLLRLLPGPYIGALRVLDETGTESAYEGPFHLGTIDPHVPREIIVRARIEPPVPDRSTVTLSAMLEKDEKQVDLGAGSIVVRSRPHVSAHSAAWELQSSEPGRPGQTRDVLVRFSNDGTDVLRDAHLVIELPADLVLDRAFNARRERNTLHFGDVAAKTTHEARFTVRLLRAPSGKASQFLDGTIYGRGVNAVPLLSMELPTFAESAFETGAQLRSTPPERVNAGERIAYELRLRNSGDGPATNLIVRAVPSNLAVYVPGSTTVNNVSVPDDVGTSALWSQRGLALTDIDPGAAFTVRFEMIVVSPIAAGTPVDARVILNWDDDKSFAIAAPTLMVTSAPTFGGASVSGAISIAQTLAQGATEVSEPQTGTWQTPPATAPAARVLPELTDVTAGDDALADIREADEPVLPVPAVAHEPVVPEPEPPLPAELTEIFARAQAAMPAADTPAVAPLQSLPIGYIDYNEERLTRALRILDKAQFGGMLLHVFAIRTFFPENIVNADADTEKSFRVYNRALGGMLDRLFVRLRIPRYTLTSKDIEDRDMRFALRTLCAEVARAPVGDDVPDRNDGVVRIGGKLDTNALRLLSTELESAPLGAAVPWLICAMMMGTSIVFEHRVIGSLAGYRDELLAAFSKMQALPLEEFHRVLRDSVNQSLDRALEDVLESLRSATRVVVD